MMAHFLVAFDRLITHAIRPVSRFDWQTRESYTEHHRIRTTREPLRQPRKRKQGRFSVYTRQYLQRRALRYFRRLGFRDPDRFGRAARTSLLLYDDVHLERPEQVLDAWGLLHLLHHGSKVLVRDPRGIRVADGHVMSELESAPMHPEAWQGCFDELVTMLAAAQSLFVRRWLVAWLKQAYEQDLEAPDIRKLKRLLWCPHPDVQRFAAELLGRARGVETLPVVEWLSLLDVDNPSAIPILCDLVARHVTPDRLDLAACVELACARPAPVAELGLRWARSKPVDDAEALHTVLHLVDVKAPTVVDDAITWIVELVGRPALGTSRHVRDLIDARTSVARAAGMKLMVEQDRFADDLMLRSALVESPYPDARAFLVKHLDQRLPGLPEAGVRRIWASTLLAISRGSRGKRNVLRQLADRLVAHPDRAPELLPLMAVALRSVREPERRCALAAIAQAAFAEPSLRAPIACHLPELELFAEESP